MSARPHNKKGILNADYVQGYTDAQHDLFWFVVALGVACVVGGAIVGLCV